MNNLDHFPAVSAHLCRVLYEIGVNTLTVTRRRKAQLVQENIHTFVNKVIKKGPDLVFCFGGQSEGTTTPDLKSDTDTLHCLTYVNVIQDWQEWQHGKLNMLMLHEGTAPGYCRLQLLRDDAPTPVEELVNHAYTYDMCNRVVLKNTFDFGHIPERQATKNGPADTHCDSRSGASHDNVTALRCSTWPVNAKRWATMHRQRNWPTRSLIQKSMIGGVFIVPVGYKLSETETLEWRISFSLTERLLMFSLNITQLRCYIVLKMVMKCIVVPSVGESISSYHCKTALFHCIEDTGVEFWTENNLLTGINMCLSFLLMCVRNEFCPHFILSESNLFAGKLNCRNKGKLVSIMKDIIESNGRFLFLLSTDKLGSKLKMNLGLSPVCISMPEYFVSIVEAESNRIIFKGYLITSVCFEQVHNTPIEAAQKVQCNIKTLCDILVQSDKNERHAISVLLEILACMLGSILASISLSRQQELGHGVLKWFLVCARYDITTQLKLAAVFFCSCNFEKAELILRNVEFVLDRKIIQTVCGCYTNKHAIHYAFCGQMVVLESAKARSQLFAHCIVYSPQEIYCIPPALRYEMHRVDDSQNLQYTDRWMTFVTIDALPFLAYLQYLTYGKLGKSDLKTRSLQNLEQCVRMTDNLKHLETAWNILGQCMEHEGKPESAMRCYRTSLEVRPTINAANWHIQKLKAKEPRLEASVEGRSVIIMDKQLNLYESSAADCLLPIV